MTGTSVSISVEKYEQLKKKAAMADDILLQLEASLNDLEAGRVKQVR